MLTSVWSQKICHASGDRVGKIKVSKESLFQNGYYFNILIIPSDFVLKPKNQKNIMFTLN